MLKRHREQKNTRDSISLDQLFEAIEKFGGVYKEQKKVLKLISRYKKGIRWKRKEAYHG